VARAMRLSSPPPPRSVPRRTVILVSSSGYTYCPPREQVGNKTRVLHAVLRARDFSEKEKEGKKEREKEGKRAMR